MIRFRFNQAAVSSHRTSVLCRKYFRNLFHSHLIKLATSAEIKLGEESIIEDDTHDILHLSDNSELPEVTLNSMQHIFVL